MFVCVRHPQIYVHTYSHVTTKFINNDNFIASSTASGGLTESDSDRTEDQKSF